MAAAEIGAARRESFRILDRVERSGAFASTLLERLSGSALDRRDVRLATELVLGTLRWRGRLDFVLAQFSRRPLPGLHAGVRTALRLAAYQILFLDRVPESAAVNGSVHLARGCAGSGAAAFANAVLRALCRGRARIRMPSPDAPHPADREAAHSHPAWMVDRWKERLGWEETRALLEANNRRAPVVLRPHGCGAAELSERLQAAGVETVPSPILPTCLRVRRGDPFRTPAFAAGDFYAQDESSQMIPLLFGLPVPGPVLDLCAAPGGKATQIAAAGPPFPLVIAADRNPARLRRLLANRRRLRLERQLLLLGADFRRGSPFAGRFPAVLLDAPCTGTGTLRRHPEIRWRLRPEDPQAMARIQAELLEAAAERLEPGGVLVFSVCSLEPEEGGQRVESFLRGHPEFRLGDARGFLPAGVHGLTTSGPYFATFPHRGDLDGFFAARLERAPR